MAASSDFSWLKIYLKQHKAQRNFLFQNNLCNSQRKRCFLLNKLQSYFFLLHKIWRGNKAYHRTEKLVDRFPRMPRSIGTLIYSEKKDCQRFQQYERWSVRYITSNIQDSNIFASFQHDMTITIFIHVVGIWSYWYFYLPFEKSAVAFYQLRFRTYIQHHHLRANYKKKKIINCSFNKSIEIFEDFLSIFFCVC